MGIQELEQLIGSDIVIDTDSRFIYIGRLDKVHGHFLEMLEVDVHDCHDSPTTREIYIVDARRSGVRPNRHRAFVTKDRIMSISKLEDVMSY